MKKLTGTEKIRAEKIRAKYLKAIEAAISGCGEQIAACIESNLSNRAISRYTKKMERIHQLKQYVFGIEFAYKWIALNKCWALRHPGDFAFDSRDDGRPIEDIVSDALY